MSILDLYLLKVEANEFEGHTELLNVSNLWIHFHCGSLHTLGGCINFFLFFLYILRQRDSVR